MHGYIALFPRQLFIYNVLNRATLKPECMAAATFRCIVAVEGGIPIKNVTVDGAAWSFHMDKGTFTKVVE